MPEIFIYLLKVNIAISLFYLGYHFLLKKLTFYSLNRFYLLFSILFSAVFPFLHLPSFFSQPDVVYYQVLSIEDSVASLPQSQETSYTLWFILLGAYWLFMALGGIKLLTRLFSLYRIHLKSSLQFWKGYKFNNLPIDTTPFSFLTTIYLNFEKHTEKELHTILKHEQVHTKNLHSFDILLVEIWCIFSWFNPISWWLKKAIKVNIEFIADREVIQQGIAHHAYQNSLLHFAVQSQSLPLANQFAFLSLKSRINMMNKKQSSKGQLGKYFLVLPIIISSLFLFGVSKAYKTSESTEIIFQELVDQPESLTSQDTTSTAKARVEIFGIKTGTGDSTASDIRNSMLIIDGVPSNQSFEELRTKVPAKDIASITVLKGQQATSLYGGQAKSGAIIITTKVGDQTEGNKDKIIFMKKTTNLAGDSITKVIGSARSIVKKESASKITVERRPATELKDSVMVTTETGTLIVKRNPESSATTFIKGKPTETIRVSVSSLDAKPQPLYIVDGKELEPSEFKYIDPNQIKSITVLKGGNVEKVYGKKGANGIIEIQLK